MSPTRATDECNASKLKVDTGLALEIAQKSQSKTQRNHVPETNQLILASQSPRRIDLLNKLGLQFEVIPSDKEEVIPPGLSPEEVVLAIAEQKAQDVVARLNDRIRSES